MKSTRKALLAIALCIALIPVLGAEENKSKPAIYQLNWNSSNVSGTILVNGFKIASMDGRQAPGIATLNVWLIGDNELKAEIKKVDVAKSAEFSVWLSKLSPRDIVDTLNRGNVLSIEKKDKDFVKAKPLKLSQQFKTELDFSAKLVKSQKCSEKDAITYALKIRDLFAKKDSACIVKEFSPKLDDYSTAFTGKNAADEFKTYLDSKLLQGRLLEIDASKVKAIKEGPKGNLWHVVTEEGELIRIGVIGGGRVEIPLYIGKIKGELKVMR